MTDTHAKTAYQDGARFYDCATDELVAIYSTMVRDDYDTAGAQAARERFLSDYPDYRMETFE